MKKQEMIMYEIDDCFGMLWQKYSKYAHLYMAYPVEPGKVDLVPFQVGCDILKEYGSFAKTRDNLRRHGLGADFYYYVEPTNETAEFREKMKFSKVVFSKDENGHYDMQDRVYFVINDLMHRLSKKEIYKMRALGLNIPCVEVINDPKVGAYLVYGDFPSGKHLLNVSDIKRIRNANLGDKLLSEENLEVYRQNGIFLTKTTLEDVFGIKKEEEVKPVIFYEFDPLIEKNPGYGDTVEFELYTFDKEGNPIYREVPKILQHDNHFEYALRVKAKEIRTFNAISKGVKGQKALKQIESDGKIDGLKAFTVYTPDDAAKNFRYFMESKYQKTSGDAPKTLC